MVRPSQAHRAKHGRGAFDVGGAGSPHYISSTLKEIAMSKGMNQKREQKRKPAKTLEEKRAAKKAKRAERTAARPV